MSKKLQIVTRHNYNKLEVGDMIIRHIWKNNKDLECLSFWQFKAFETIGGLHCTTTLNGSFYDDSTIMKAIHLHFLCDDEIKEGDYFIGDSIDKPEMAKVFENNGILVNGFIKSACKKVYASTDKRLNIDLVPSVELLELICNNDSLEGIEHFNNYFQQNDLIIKEFSKNDVLNLFMELQNDMAQRVIKDTERIIPLDWITEKLK